MEQPTQHTGDSDSEGSVEAPDLLTIEEELKRASNAERIASGDAWLYARHAAKVLARLREVSPAPVEAAEREVSVHDD